jgi:Holliday junction resolvase RusA-like endonuclease
MRIRFNLPIPPSTNGAYATAKRAGRRFKSKRAVDYTALCLTHLRGVVNANKDLCHKTVIFRDAISPNKKCDPQRLNKHVRIKPSYSIMFIYHFPNNRVTDIFNFEKLITDILVDVGLLLDDQYIDFGVVSRGAVHPKTPHVEMIIKYKNALAFSEISLENTHTPQIPSKRATPPRRNKPMKIHRDCQ